MAVVTPPRVLFVGLGSIGQRHLRNLRAHGPFEYTALRSRGRALPDDLSDLPIRVVHDLDAAAATRPDLVFLCAPPAIQRVALERLARDTRAHLFIEKPIALAVDGLEACAAEVEAQGRVAMVGYNLRFHPTVRRVGEWLDDGRLGRIASARVTVGQFLPDWHPAEDYREGYSAKRALGGGVLLDLIHELDLLYSWFGRPQAVKAMAGRLSSLEIETEDTAEVLLRFESGVIGSAHLDYVARTARRGGVIVGDAATISYDLLACSCDVQGPRGVEESEAWPSFVRNDMYATELETFLTAVREGRPAMPTLRDGLDVLAIANQARLDSGIESAAP